MNKTYTSIKVYESPGLEHLGYCQGGDQSVMSKCQGYTGVCHHGHDQHEGEPSNLDMKSWPQG